MTALEELSAYFDKRVNTQLGLQLLSYNFLLLSTSSHMIIIAIQMVYSHETMKYSVQEFNTYEIM